MKLLINAGGKGTRMYPLTLGTPKPMIRVAGKPILEHIIDWAKRNGVTDIVILAGYLSDQIVDYFGDGTAFGVRISYSIEPHLLGTGGAIRFARPFISETFAYINGDQFCTVDLQSMMRLHQERGALITAFVDDVVNPGGDTLDIDSQGNVVRFVSKLDSGQRGKYVNRGVCIIEPAVLDLMDKEEFNFENYIYPKALARGLVITAYRSDAQVLSIESVEHLRVAEEFLRK